MKIPELSENLSIISQLGNNPGTDDGLSADELKAKFDEAVLIIQRYINQTLLPKVNASVYPEDGLTMRADIAMGGHRVTGVGAPEEDGDAVNLGYAKKVGNPNNLLDNSDFRNPVNQRGQTTYNAYGYGIDRWILGSASCVATIKDGYISISSASTGQQMLQNINKDEVTLDGKKVTIACCDKDGNVYCKSGTVTSGGTITAPVGNSDIRFYWSASSGKQQMIINPKGYEMNLQWIALYEGEYTAETLPDYHPKGYGAELAECSRYYRRSWSGENVSSNCAICFTKAEGANTYPSVNWDTPMRINPTVTLRTWSDVQEEQTGHVRNWGTGVAYPASVGYKSAHGFAVEAKTAPTGTPCAFHYEASADL